MTQASGPIVYRSVAPTPATASELCEYHNTMRPPGNVPYLVDNLWEWKRPEGYPNRRYSAYASPTPDLAKQSGPKDGEVYRVEFAGAYKLCQLVDGNEDSKYHPECKSLRQKLLKLLGQQWIDESLTTKKDIGRLWMPCLTRDEINSVFDENEALRNVKDQGYSPPPGPR